MEGVKKKNGHQGDRSVKKGSSTPQIQTPERWGWVPGGLGGGSEAWSSAGVGFASGTAAAVLDTGGSNTLRCS
jgi:hypothetical protein